MEMIQDFFVCDGCLNKDFTRIHNFSIRFHGVNFSDELIYERLTEERYQCARCQKIFTKSQIDDTLIQFKKSRRRE